MIEYSPDEKAAQEAREEMQKCYQSLFGTPLGRKVLGHILSENHFGVPLNSDVERIEYNVAVAIARMSGMMSEIDRLAGITEG